MTERPGRAQQVILLCLLALCVTAMHHITASSGEPPVMNDSFMTAAAATGSGEHHAPGHDGTHDLRHLCLAILTVFGGLLLLTRLLFPRRPNTRTPDTRSPTRRTPPRGSPAPDRPPDRPGRTVLTSLCVLRV
ncbi:hypothetical protein [Amycolatopsis sp.]|uniref:hypothetical protein n=1 Tax=Amycolatopsis sp. TaxID=37632 RepID=UPI002D80A0F1|nr:hypothetical protein [Amycolatopsis sp.]HET6708696.1 hypothetical protein [Amycolatopsis sp.]